MSKRLNIQLELEDIFFHKIDHIAHAQEHLIFNSKIYLVRNHLKDFFDSLHPYFNFSIWTTYEPEVADCLKNYIKSFGINLLYVRTDCYAFNTMDGKTDKGKRLKRIRVDRIEIEETICIESKIPVTDNHHNYIILENYFGQDDNVLLDAAIRLLELRDIDNTTKIN